jgi:hypothetical protein
MFRGFRRQRLKELRMLTGDRRELTGLWRASELVSSIVGVQRAELVAGRTYALKPTSEQGEADVWVKVRYGGKAHRSRVQVRFLTGDLTGLDDWVRTAQLVCPWGEWKRARRDEEGLERVREVSASAWDRVVEEAISLTFTASGEYGGFTRRWDTLPGPAMRLWQRADLEGTPLANHPANFADRHGVWQLTFQTAEVAAKAFASAEPDLVALYLRGWEERWRAEGFTPGNRHSHDMLRELAPSLALARSWTQEPRGAAAEREVLRLQGLVADAVAALRRHGHETEASRLTRALGGD